MSELLICPILTLKCSNTYFLAMKNHIGKMEMWSSCFSLVVCEIKDGITRGFSVSLNFTACINTAYALLCI